MKFFEYKGFTVVYLFPIILIFMFFFVYFQLGDAIMKKVGLWHPDKSLVFEEEFKIIFKDYARDLKLFSKYFILYYSQQEIEKVEQNLKVETIAEELNVKKQILEN